jgi:hypothetical protein
LSRTAGQGLQDGEVIHPQDIYLARLVTGLQDFFTRAAVARLLPNI